MLDEAIIQFTICKLQLGTNFDPYNSSPKPDLKYALTFVHFLLFKAKKEEKVHTLFGI